MKNNKEIYYNNKYSRVKFFRNPNGRLYFIVTDGGYEGFGIYSYEILKNGVRIAVEYTAGV